MDKDGKLYDDIKDKEKWISKNRVDFKAGKPRKQLGFNFLGIGEFTTSSKSTDVFREKKNNHQPGGVHVSSYSCGKHTWVDLYSKGNIARRGWEGKAKPDASAAGRHTNSGLDEFTRDEPFKYPGGVKVARSSSNPVKLLRDATNN